MTTEKKIPGESGKNEPMQQGRGWRKNEEKLERGREERKH